MRKQNAFSVSMTPDLHENLVKLCELTANATNLSSSSSSQPQLNLNTATGNANNNNTISFDTLYNNEQRKASSAKTSSSSLLLNLEFQKQLLKSRKSVIGSRLERSSFQAQRLSDVGVAFGQQLTAKMGLKLPASQERIVEQTRKLYLKYLFKKLRQNSLPLRDLNLTKSSKVRRAYLSDKKNLFIDQTGSDMMNFVPPKIVCSAPSSALPLVSDSSSGPFVLPKITTTSPHQSPPPINHSRRRATLTSQELDKNQLPSMSLTKVLREKSKQQFENNFKLLEEDSSGSEKVKKSILLNNNNNNYSSSNQNVDSEKSEVAQSSNSNLALNNPGKRFVMDATINNQIFIVLWRIINEFRELKPDYHGDTIYEHVGIDKFSSLDSLLDVQLTICQEMTRSEISWCRICALFSLIGSMSLDCVRLGLPEHVGPLLDGFIEFVEKDLALWISQQGGWESFLYKYRASYTFEHLKSITILSLVVPLSLWAIIRVFC